MAKAIVAASGALRDNPRRHRPAHGAGVAAMDPSKTTILKDNISWHFPSRRQHHTVAARRVIRGLAAAGFHDQSAYRTRRSSQRLQGEDLNHYVRSSSRTTSRPLQFPRRRHEVGRL